MNFKNRLIGPNFFNPKITMSDSVKRLKKAGFGISTRFFLAAKRLPHQPRQSDTDHRMGV